MALGAYKDLNSRRVEGRIVLSGSAVYDKFNMQHNFKAECPERNDVEVVKANHFD